MSTYRLGNALIPKGRLAEFIGKNAARQAQGPPTEKPAAHLTPPGFKPEQQPTLAEVLSYLKSIERKIDLVRKVVVNPDGDRELISRSLRMALSAQEQHQLRLMEQAFITVYANPKITAEVLRSSTRKRPVSNARSFLFKLISDRVPSITFASLGLYFMKHSTSVYYAIEKVEKAMKDNRSDRLIYVDLDRKWRSELERLGGAG